MVLGDFFMEQLGPRFHGNLVHLALSSLEFDEFFTDGGGTPLCSSL